MKFIVALVVFACFAVLAVTADRKVVHLEHRSAPIVIAEKTSKRDGSVVFLMDRFVKQYSEMPALDERDLASLISHSVGGPEVTPAQEVMFPAANVLSKSKANLFVTVDGLTEKDFSGRQLRMPNAVAVPLERSFVPADSFASMTSMATGSSPSEHGIVSSEWHSGRNLVRAFSDAESSSSVANVADLFVEAFRGHSLIVSASADEQLAAIFSPHVRSHRTEQLMTSRTVLNWVQADKDALKARVMARLSSRADLLSLFNADKDSAFFVDLELLAHIGTAEHLAQDMADATPDLFFITVGSVAEIAERYSRQSPQFNAAVELVHEAIVAAVQRLSVAYHAKLTAQVVLLHSQQMDVATERNLRERVLQQLQSLLPSREMFLHFFPAIYLRPDVDAQQACQAVQETLFAAGLADSYEVVCTADVAAANQKRQTPTPAPTPEPTPEPTSAPTPAPTPAATTVAPTTTVGPTTSPAPPKADTAMEIFHVVLWFSILLILALGAGVWIMYDMDIDKESTIYRATVVKLR